MELQEYYKKLREYLKDIRIFSKSIGNESDKTEKLEPLVIPFLSYILASCPDNHQRIDQIYDAYGTKGERLEERFAETDPIGLSSTMTLPARIRYRKLIMICLSEDGQTRKQLLRMLKRVCPNSYMDHPEYRHVTAALMTGAFDLKHLSVVWLSLYLQRFSMNNIFMDFPSYLWKQFIDSMLKNFPMPGFKKIPEACRTEDEGQFGDIIDAVVDENDRTYSRQLEMTKEFLELSDRNRKRNSRILSKELPLGLLKDPGKVLDSMIDLSGDYCEIIKEACRHPEVVARDEWIRKPEAMDALHEEVLNNPEQTANECQLNFTILIYTLMRTAGLGYEELYHARILPEDLTAINAACIMRTDFEKESNGPQNTDSEKAGQEEEIPNPREAWRILSTGERMAAFLICALARRARNAENALEAALNVANSSKIDKDEDTPVQEIENESIKDVKNLSQEALLELRTKNKELIAQIREEKEKRRKLIETLEKANADLSFENKQLQDTVNQLLITQEESEKEDKEAKKDINREELERMKKVIVDAGILFVCGHPSWRTAMKTEFPQSKFVEPRDYNITGTIFRNANFIVYHLQHANHSMYYKCLELKNKEARILFIDQNNTARCIKQIYDYIMTHGRKKQEVETEKKI